MYLTNCIHCLHGLIQTWKLLCSNFTKNGSTQKHWLIFSKSSSMRITPSWVRQWGLSTTLGYFRLSIRIISSLAVLFLCTIRFFFFFFFIFFLLCFRVLVFGLICLILCFCGDCWCLELQTLEFLECRINGILIWISRKFKRIDFWKNYEIVFLGVVWFGL